MFENSNPQPIPKQTRLLANYPNPFNEGTWIPFQLANASDVKIIIYDIQSEIIRVMDLGYQAEGYYTNKTRAVYWDCKNQDGLKARRGLYFYRLQTEINSSLRKMMILR